MDAELERHLNRIYAAIDGLRAAQVDANARMEEHHNREGGRDIHHIPPCTSFEDHIEEIKADKREDRRNTIAVAALVAAVVGLLFKMFL